MEMSEYGFYSALYFPIFELDTRQYKPDKVSRSSSPEVFLGKDVMNICSKFTGEHPCRTAISIKLQSNFI